MCLNELYLQLIDIAILNTTSPWKHNFTFCRKKLLTYGIYETRLASGRLTVSLCAHKMVFVCRYIVNNVVVLIMSVLGYQRRLSMRLSVCIDLFFQLFIIEAGAFLCDQNFLCFFRLAAARLGFCLQSERPITGLFLCVRESKMQVVNRTCFTALESYIKPPKITLI